MFHATIEKLHTRARVFIANKPLWLDSAPPLPERYVAIDLEYDGVQNLVFLACLRVVGIEPTDRLTVYADQSHQAELIDRIKQFLEEHPNIPMVTWGGNGADLPQLLKTIARWTINGGPLVDELKRRHIDARLIARKTAILPAQSWSEADVARYLGVHRETRTKDGFYAVRMWQSHGGEEDARDELIKYNRADVDTLIDIMDMLRTRGKISVVKHDLASDNLVILRGTS